MNQANRQDSNIREDDRDEVEQSGEAIAVIGMSGRFPGAPNLDRFWANLRGGVESLESFDRETLRAEGVPDHDSSAPSYVPRGAPIDGVDRFDARFFGVTPREAEGLDPQQRLFLETAYHALENAGYRPDRLSDRVGVFAGSRFSDYLVRHLYSNPSWLHRVGYFQALLGNDKDYLAPLVSYKLNLTGPSISVQTACSTSLVAVELACEALISHTANLALAGGVSVRLPQRAGYHYHSNSIFSRTGHVRAFDASADGTVFGNGVAVVVLKRLQDALDDGDFVYGTIIGSAVNNDGGRKVGLTAPAADGQARVIADALAIAEVDPADLQYVECHGTGTTLGDAIEIAALARVFGSGRPAGRVFDRPDRCALGSVKTNIGHLEAAAGIAGFIKVMLMLHHKRLVPSLHFERGNPQIDFDQTPFYVNTVDAEWPKPHNGPRRAGISSFGIGGTNAHLIVEEAARPRWLESQGVEPQGAEQGQRPHLVRLSARSPAALDRACVGVGAYLEKHAELPLAHVAATLGRGRQGFEYRRMCLARSGQDAAARLRDGQGCTDGKATGGDKSVVFLFPGQGVQYPGMARDVYQGSWAESRIFRAIIDQGAEILQPLLHLDLRELMFARPGDASAAERLRRTALTQPAIFLLEMALARLWHSWGIVPAAMLGHSVGEYVAACLAGVLSFEDGLALIAERGRLVDSLPSGSMVSVQLDRERLSALLPDQVEIAAENGFALTVASGPSRAVDELVASLVAGDISHRRVVTSHAFHSAMLEPCLDRFRAAVSRVALQPPERPFVSNVTGTWITDQQACDPDYWVRHLRQPVLFARGLRTLADQAQPVFIEVGPGRVATTFARATLPGAHTITCLPDAMAAEQDSQTSLLAAVGRLWLAGVDLDEDALYPQARRVPLPGYPFERDRHWVEARAMTAPPAVEVPPTGQRPGQQPALQPARQAVLSDDGIVGDRAGHIDNRPSGLGSRYVAPADDVETAVAAIWQEQLGVSPVGREDAFVDLGGHSLLATRIATRIHETLGVELDLALFFAAGGGRVADLAAAIGDQRSGKASAKPRLEPFPREGELPLTPAQERMWFLHRLAPHSPAYNLPGAFPVDGPLDLAALQNAIGDLVQRHEILRCRFPYRGNRPVVEVAPRALIELPLADLSELAADEQARRIDELRRTDAGRAFDLERGLALRASVLRLAADRHIVLFNVHHIVADGGSFGILARDLGELYRARLEDRPAVLPALEVQYIDYAFWLHSYLGGPRMERLENYWHEHLAGAPQVFEIDTDFARPEVADYRGARIALSLDAEMTAALRALARRYGATPFMALLAAFQVLLWNRTGNTDFLIGTHSTQRNHRYLENLVGLFVNQLVLRADLSGNPSFAAVLERVRSDVVSAFAHQELPFERLVELLRAERDLSRTPIIQVLLVYQNHPPVQPGGAVLPAGEASDEQVIRNDLQLVFFEDGESLRGFLEYRSSLFAAKTMARLAEQLVELIGLVTAQPELTLHRIADRLPHLDADAIAARNRVLSNPSKRSEQPVLWRILNRAEQSPDRVAVVSVEEPAAELRELRYGELITASRRLAVVLRRAGVGREVTVGLFMDRSAAFMIGWLATWLAGGAFVPLDIHSGPRRLIYQLQTSGTRVLVTTRAWRDQLALEVADGRHIAIVDDLIGHLGESDAGSGQKSLARLVPQQTAYVLFTSGSTGEPKGVAVEHRNLAGYVDAIIDQLDMKPVSYGWILSTVGDAGHTAFIPPLVLGGCVHAIGPSMASQPALLAAYLRERDVSFVKIFPGMLQALQVGGRIADIMPTRHLVLGGEKSQLSWRRELHRAAPHCRIDNHYGPTETSIGVVTERFEPDDTEQAQTSPLGRPLPGVRAYLVDPLDRPVADGQRGELHIGGDLVARGYVGRPGLTAERFIPDPWSVEPGARRYRTGDCAHVDDSGRLFFRGRIDAQVKLRGFRIEPGEIENVLHRSEWVGRAAVVLRPDPRPRLVAYVVPANGTDGHGRAGHGTDSEMRGGSRSRQAESSELADRLRAWLTERLPPVMIPSAFVLMDKLPLSRNGKLDTSALPTPSGTRTGSRRPPETPLGRQLAALWAQVLGCDQVGLDDNFFELGGDSLLSIQLITLANRAGLRLTPQLLFRHQTLAEQTLVLDSAGRAPGFDQRALVMLQPAGDAAPLFCVHPAGGMVFGYLALARALGPSLPLFALQDVTYLRHPVVEYTVTVQELAARYVDEVVTAWPEGAVRLAGHSFGGLVALELGHRLRAIGRSVSLIALLDTRPPHDDDSTDDGDTASDERLDILVHMVTAMYRLQGCSAPVEAAALGPLTEAERLQRASAVLRELDMYRDLTPPRLASTLAVYSAHHAAAVSYRPDIWPGELILCRPRDEPAPESGDPGAGWSRYASRGVTVLPVAGDHTTMLTADRVGDLAAGLRRWL
ncbi:MAG: amino acid adenylation domain-containing protein [Proteobacteria bacterium]|nr:amino acid adenylation domain-containing protein [Pseudomonadota bacterium]